MKVAQILQNYGDHIKVSGTRRVTWISIFRVHRC